MFQRQLFLGICITHEDEFFLSKISPEMRRMFIRNDSDYLQEITYEDQKFIGKYISGITDRPSLELLESNIYSLLKKLIPQFSQGKSPLWILPIVQSAE